MIESSSFQTVKNAVGRVLRHSPGLYAAASRLLYSFDRSFQTLSPGSPEAIDKAWRVAAESQVGRVGDYYEFGVFRGYVLWHAQRSAKAAGFSGIRYWGFDSFQGLPTVEGIDRSQGRFFKGQFACTREAVESNLREHDADMDEIRLIPGFFSESLTPALKTVENLRPVGVAMIDCDLYSSTVNVLTWLADLLQDGSVLLFDDWHTFGGDQDLGQPRAMREFLADHPQWRADHLYDFRAHGRAFQMRTQ